MREDLPAQEAVFRDDVALNVDEAQDPAWILVCQLQRGQATHRMPDEVETLDPGALQYSPGGLYQERYRYFRHLLAGGLPASRCVIGEERTPGEGGLECDVDVIFLR